MKQRSKNVSMLDMKKVPGKPGHPSEQPYLSMKVLKNQDMEDIFYGKHIFKFNSKESGELYNADSY